MSAPTASSPSVDDARYIKALSHPVRARVLAALERETSSPVRLSENLRTSLGIVSYHVRELKRAGLIELVEVVPRRGAVEHRYRAVSRQPATPTLEPGQPQDSSPAAAAAALLEEGRRATAAGGFDSAEARFAHATLTVDEEGWKAIAEARRRLLEEAEAIGRSAAARLATNGGQARPVTLGVIQYEAFPLAPAVDD